MCIEATSISVAFLALLPPRGDPFCVAKILVVGVSSSMSCVAKLKSTHSAIFWSIASGMAALIYQVVLQKLFTYVLGYALLSTTIVIAAYMLGLALGGFLAGLFCDRLTRSSCLAVYALLEAGIGIFGLGSLFGYKAYLARLTSLLASPGSFTSCPLWPSGRPSPWQCCFP